MWVLGSDCLLDSIDGFLTAASVMSTLRRAVWGDEILSSKGVSGRTHRF